MNYRRATINEIDILANLRKQQLIDEGMAPSSNIDLELHNFFLKKMEDGTLIEWVAIDNEEIIATAAIIFYDFPPNFINKSGVRGYIANVYTKPEYRGRGIATSLIDKLVEEAKARGVKKLWLAASEMGRPVYIKYGFVETDEYLELNFD